MAQGLGHRRDFCNICGAEMSSYGIEDHQRHVHPDIFERRQREFSHALGRAALVFVPAGAAFFLALFVPDVIFGTVNRAGTSESFSSVSWCQCSPRCRMPPGSGGPTPRPLETSSCSAPFSTRR